MNEQYDRNDAWAFRTASYKPRITKSSPENVRRAFHEIRLHIDPWTNGPNQGGPCGNPEHVIAMLREWGVLND